MDAPPKDGMHMKSRSRKVMIITALGMIIMIANGQRDQHADEKGEMANFMSRAQSINIKRRRRSASSSPVAKPTKRAWLKLKLAGRGDAKHGRTKRGSRRILAEKAHKTAICTVPEVPHGGRIGQGNGHKAR